MAFLKMKEKKRDTWDEMSERRIYKKIGPISILQLPPGFGYFNQ